MRKQPHGTCKAAPGACTIYALRRAVLDYLLPSRESAVKHRLLFSLVMFVGTSLFGCGGGSTPSKGPGPVQPAEETTTPSTEDDGSAEERPDQSPAEAASTSSTTEDRIITPMQLIAALEKQNPGFHAVERENMNMQPISADLLEMAINDPAVKDISPLRKQRIAKLDLRFCDITDLSPLEGMPISELYVEENKRLSDLSPLRGMPLHKLYLTNTAVENLGPLRGAPLMELNAVGARIKDLEPISECPLQMLWLTDCPVTDISPLKKTPLVSLTLENTPVEDISPLAGHSLQRLHIAGTKVKDLTPVGQMQLTRLIFTPSRIEKGIDVVRKSKSIGEIGTSFDGRLAPVGFWKLYDEGKLPE